MADNDTVNDIGHHEKIQVTFGRVVNTGNYSSMRLEFTTERTVGVKEKSSDLLASLTEDLRKLCDQKIKDVLEKEM